MKQPFVEMKRGKPQWLAKMARHERAFRAPEARETRVEW